MPFIRRQGDVTKVEFGEELAHCLARQGFRAVFGQQAGLPVSRQIQRIDPIAAYQLMV
jgi:hypothetical protein